MRIGLVCPYDLSKPGGVQAQVLGLAKALESGGDDAVVIGPGLPSGVSGVDLGRSVVVPGNGSKVPISIDPTVLRVMRSVAGNIDLLHVHEPLMPTVSFSALRVGVPVVATFHAAPGEMGRRFYTLLGGRLKTLLGRNLRRVTAVSETARAALPPDLGVTIVPNGIDAASLRVDGERSPRRVAFLGRDEPRKGLEVLLEAWPLVLESVPEAELVVMGAERDVPGIEWLGWVDDETKTEVLNNSAIYVAPNTGGESFGIVLLEAMAAGAAVVASDLDAFSEVGGHAVQFFENGDALALAAEIVHLFQHENIRSGLSDAGRARAAEFDWSVVTAAYRTIYEESLS